jgi:hypothetical protein
MRSTLAFVLTASASLLLTSGNLGAQTDLPSGLNCDNEFQRWRAGAKYKEGDRVVGLGANLYICKGGAATALCDDPGYEPDIDERASDAWQRLGGCLIGDGSELQTTELVVSSMQCKSGRGVLTLTATITNESAFKGTFPVAFYYGANRTLIASVPITLPEERFGEPFQVSTTWVNPPLQCALITVVADDDGTGRGTRLEYNETDNEKQVKLPTCPIPKPGPL